MGVNKEREQAGNATGFPHSNWSGYSLESCSPAELSSASPDWTKIKHNSMKQEKSFQHTTQNK